MASERKVALITGITGQDGSYLAEFLLEKGYEVHGLARQCTNTTLINHLLPGKDSPKQDSVVKLHGGDLTDSSRLSELIGHIKPTEIYNLGAQSHANVSFGQAEYTGNVDALGVLRLLDAIRINNLQKHTKFFQASSAEMFGKTKTIPQTEETPFHPGSPYSVAKLYGYWMTVMYREGYDIFAANGIMFSHESPRRGEKFVTRKITQAVCNIYLGQQEVLELGNINSRRDWGHSQDYVEAMWLMLQQEKPDDYIVATKECHSVRQFVEIAFKHVGITIEWEGEGVNEVGKDAETNIVRVKINPMFYRPIEVDLLCGDPTKAKNKLGWKPKHTFMELVKDMMDSDLENIRATLQLDSKYIKIKSEVSRAN